MLTYYFGDQALSLRYPAGWRTEEAEQEGVWYRYFLGPPGEDRKPSVSVTLLAAESGATLDAYAQSYLAGNTVSATRDEDRQGARARTWRFASADGRTRYSLLLIGEQSRVYGLFSQGQARPFGEHLPRIEEMEKSLTLERPARYAEFADDRFAFRMRVPSSWRQVRSFSGGPAYLLQFSSPAVGFENGQTLHASLILNVEPARGDGSLDAFYGAAKQTLGDTQRILSHTAWRGGYVDLTRQETPVAETRGKRFYFAAGGRGYTLTCEARDDVFHVVSRWCDLIATTLQVGPSIR